MMNEAPQQRRGSARASQELSNSDLLRAVIEAYNRRDFGVLAEFFDPEVELHIASGQANPGTWHGIDGFRAMVESWRDAFAEDSSTLYLREVREGLAVRFHIYADREAALRTVR
jgi:hypothetical protein